jgi:hypothetical protein
LESERENEVRSSVETNEIATGLAKAQGAMKNATLNKVNPHYRSKYADLAEIRDAVIPSLSANGISVTQPLDVVDGQSVVFTRLTHSSGQWLESCCLLPPFVDMQKLGSAITYARRYSLSAICAIAADEDDDANAAVTIAPQATAIPAVPEGYEQWALDLEAVADEGTDALKAAWKKSQPYMRKYLTDTNAEIWQSLKNHAAAVTAATNS